ncbi:unnamed protein product [Mytilus coruscus]|uniref:G-protein coupled receptors family 1 profile domain-containing protein n=1 Tax=Mytilus coruscus TaxID=42192 RepID=A0A6J8DLS4_MYTCO|nr:unnamed protein product [Mytilus coruscus]
MFNSNETHLNSSHNQTNLTTSENATKVEYLNITSRNDIEFHDQSKVWLPFEIVSIVLATGSISVCVLVIIFAFKKNGKTFFKWKRAQRFVVLTSACDILFYGVQFILNIDTQVSGLVPPPVICSIYAFFLLEFAYAQSNLSIITAATACYYILKQAEIDLGKYDWKMFSFMFVYPAILLATASFNGGMAYNGV